MRKSIIALSMLAAFSSFSNVASEIPKGFPQFDPATIYKQIDHDALVRGYVDMNPDAAFMALYNAYLNEGSTKNHVGIMETSVDPRQTVLTANSETLYAVHPVNLADNNGAVILEVPHAVLGMVNSPGWNIVGDLGITGPDGGKGGTYIITGPTFEGDIPDGMYHIESDANTIVWLLRGFVIDNDWVAAADHLKTIKTYTLDNSKVETSFYNTSESIVNNDKNMDMSWKAEQTFELITQYIKQNAGTPHSTKHGHTIAGLYEAGLLDGTVTKEQLMKATEIGEQRVKVISFSNRDNSAKKWGKGNLWEWANPFSDEFYTGKGSGIYQPSQQLAWTHKATFTAAGMTRPAEGTGSAYIEANRDSMGAFLDGALCYQLEVPADVPQANFWSVIAYDAVERSMVVNQDNHWGVNSYNEEVTVNSDGSVTMTFGPESGSGDANHIQTNENEGFFLWFRTYSPTSSWYDNSWVLPNVEKVNC
ncbi:DUF1214 domain-containing protein [Vibrio lamellibrachiae]|uniref:DUF1214 domain-containing protein n=1 Tax=Vibrio lamellibrachiae TaxID=2910253 RepID=UPI003D13EC02